MTLDTELGAGTGQRAGRKEWLALAVLALPLLLVSMDVSVLYFAVPFIGADLAPTAAQQLWIFDVYGFVLAGLLLGMGAVGDIFGRRRVLLIGAVAFSAASLFAAYSGSAELLIAARALQGLAGATLMPSTLGLIRSMFHDAKQRGRAIAIWTAVMTGGIALGPVLSGILLEHFWWGSVFLINVPAMVLLLILGPFLLPETPRDRSRRFDLPGAVLALATVLTVIWGVKQWATEGFAVGYPAAIVAGLLAGGLFVVRQRTAADPMLDLSLFRSRLFSAGAISNAVAMFALVGNAVFLTQYLQAVQGLSPFVAALWSIVPSIPVSAAAPIAMSAAAKVGRLPVICAGFLVAAAGFVTMTQVGVDGSLAVVLIAAGILGVGTVVVLTLAAEIAMGSTTPEKAGTVAAVVETSGELGGALGIAVLGSVGAAAYAHSVAAHLPAAVPADVAGQLKSTIGEAVAVATGIGGDAGAALLLVSRSAFTDSMTVVSICGAVVLVLAAGMAAVLARTTRQVRPEPAVLTP
ncbi:MFS transporter [Nakamurella lactea]|uniref:MFS transporter n=1 Tax=Nakamurella lactea TaxID=459515 RepID=UPI00041806D3|nr:MFS transporter [Nakamurella lactea]